MAIDYRTMSDDELVGAYSQRNSATDLSKLSDSQLMSMYKPQQEKPKFKPTPRKGDPSLIEYGAKRLGQGALQIADAFAGVGEGAVRSTLGEGAAAPVQAAREKYLVNPQTQINEDIGQSQSFVSGEDSLKSKFDKGTLGAGDVLKAGADLALTQAPQVANSLVAGKLGAKVFGALASRNLVAGGMTQAATRYAPAMTEAAVKGNLAGNIAAMSAQETGSIYNEQKDGQKDLLKAAAMGVPAGLLEGVAQFHTMGRAGIAGLIDDAMKPAEKLTMKSFAKNTAKTVLEEGSTEAAQSVLEQAGAKGGGLAAIPHDIMNNTDWTDVLESGIAGAVMGGGINALGAGVQKTSELAKGIMDRREDRIATDAVNSADQKLQELALKQQEELIAQKNAQAPQDIENIKAKALQGLVQDSDLRELLRIEKENPDAAIQQKASKAIETIQKVQDKQEVEQMKLEGTDYAKEAKHAVADEKHPEMVLDPIKEEQLRIDAQQHPNELVRKSALDAVTKIDENRTKLEEKAQQDEIKTQQSIQDEQYKGKLDILKEQEDDAKKAAAVETAKLDLKQKQIAKKEDMVGEVGAPILQAEKKVIAAKADIGIKAAEQKVELLTKAQEESALKTTEAEKKATYTASFMGTQEAYEMVMKHATKLVDKAKEVGAAAWKTFKQFAADMHDYFGEHVKPHLLKMWKGVQDYVKDIQPGLSTQIFDKDGNPISMADAMNKQKSTIPDHATITPEEGKSILDSFRTKHTPPEIVSAIPTVNNFTNEGGDSRHEGTPYLVTYSDGSKQELIPNVGIQAGDVEFNDSYFAKNRHIDTTKFSTFAALQEQLKQFVDQQEANAPPQKIAASPETIAEANKIKAQQAAQRPINIFHGTGENKTLSNFAHRPFRMPDGSLYHSVEHAYQTWKSGAEDKATNAAYNFKEQMTNKKDPSAHFEGKIPGKFPADNTKNIGMIKALMRMSFEQNPEAKEELLATGEVPLTHKQGGGIWKEAFPRVLTELRSEFQGKALPPQTKTPIVSAAKEDGITRHKENDGFDFGGAVAKVVNGVAHIREDKIKDIFNNRKTLEEIEGLNKLRPWIGMKYKKMGITPEQFFSVFKSAQELEQYYISHELAHIKNGDEKNQDILDIWAKTQKYPNKNNALTMFKTHPKVIDMEIAATLGSLTKEQRVALGLEQQEVAQEEDYSQPEEEDYQSAFDGEFQPYALPGGNDEVMQDEVPPLTDEPLVESRTPEFDKLPAYTPGQKSMTYAGIGSRGTKTEPVAEGVLNNLRRAAAYLGSLGYTVNTGNASGADAQFREGGIKVNEFTPKDATPQTLAIAREIHPHPEAIDKKDKETADRNWALHARNTHQVFGEDLNTPVDFVLCYTKDGAETTRGQGGTGQAMDMAIRKGIPVINTANEGWLQKLQAIVDPTGQAFDTVAQEKYQQKMEEIAAIDKWRLDAKELAASITEPEALLQDFNQSKKDNNGALQVWMREREKIVGKEQAEKDMDAIWGEQFRQAQSYNQDIVEMLPDGTVTLKEDSKLVNLPGFLRVIAGAHGLYVELSQEIKPFVVERDKNGEFVAGKQRHGYTEHWFEGIKIYDQEDTVNYAEYIPGAIYVELASAYNLPTIETLTKEALDKVKADFLSAYQDRRGRGTFSYKARQKLADLYEATGFPAVNDLLDAYKAYYNWQVGKRLEDVRKGQLTEENKAFDQELMQEFAAAREQQDMLIEDIAKREIINKVDDSVAETPSDFEVLRDMPDLYKHVEDTYGSAPINRTIRYDNNGNIVDSRSTNEFTIIKPEDDSLDDVKSLVSIELDRFYKGRKDVSDEHHFRDADAFSSIENQDFAASSNLRSMEQITWELLKEERDFIVKSAQEFNDNPNFKINSEVIDLLLAGSPIQKDGSQTMPPVTSETIAKLMAEPGRYLSEVAQQVIDAGYSFKSLYYKSLKEENGKTFKTMKKLPQLLFSFIEKIKSKNEIKAQKQREAMHEIERIVSSYANGDYTMEKAVNKFMEWSRKDVGVESLEKSGVGYLAYADGFEIAALLDYWAKINLRKRDTVKEGTKGVSVSNINSLNVLPNGIASPKPGPYAARFEALVEDVKKFSENDKISEYTSEERALAYNLKRVRDYVGGIYSQQKLMSEAKFKDRIAEIFKDDKFKPAHSPKRVLSAQERAIVISMSLKPDFMKSLEEVNQGQPLRYAIAEAISDGMGAGMYHAATQMMDQVSPEFVYQFAEFFTPQTFVRKKIRFEYDAPAENKALTREEARQKEKERQAIQYQGFAEIAALNQKFGSLVGAMYAAFDAQGYSKNKAVNSQNLKKQMDNYFSKEAFIPKTASTEKKAAIQADFDMAKATYMSMGDESFQKVAAQFMNMQQLWVGEFGTLLEGDIEEGGAERNEDLRSVTPLGMEGGSEFSAEPHFQPAKDTRQGEASLPIVNAKGGTRFTSLDVSELGNYQHLDNMWKIFNYVQEQGYADLREERRIANDANRKMHDLGEYARLLNLKHKREKSIDYAMEQTEGATPEQKAALEESIRIIKETKSLIKYKNGKVVSNQSFMGLNEIEEKLKTVRFKLGSLAVTEADIKKHEEKLEKKEFRDEARFAKERSAAYFRYDRDPEKLATVLKDIATREQDQLDYVAWERSDKEYRNARIVIEKQKGYLQNALLVARKYLMKKAFEQSHVLDAAYFEGKAADYLEQTGENIETAKLYDLFLNSGADIGVFNGRLNSSIREVQTREIEDAYKNGTKWFGRSAQYIVLSRMSEQDRTLYGKVAPYLGMVSRANTLDANNEELSFAEKTSENKPLDDELKKIEKNAMVEYRSLSPAMQERFLAIFNAEQHLNSLAAKAFRKTAPKPKKAIKEQKLDVFHQPIERKPAPEDPGPLFAQALENKMHEDVWNIADSTTPKIDYTAQEQAVADKYPAVKIVGVRSLVLQTFFKKIANWFGAEYVTVLAGEEFHGSYIPNVSGKPTIVLNLNSNKSLARVYAHELFHHILNKLSPQAYQAFRNAIREAYSTPNDGSVGNSLDPMGWQYNKDQKNEWEIAVMQVAKRMGATVKTVRDIYTNEFNSNPKGTVTRGESGETLLDQHQEAGYKPFLPAASTNKQSTAAFDFGQGRTTKEVTQSSVDIAPGRVNPPIASIGRKHKQFGKNPFNHSTEENLSKNEAVLPQGQQKLLGQETIETIDESRREEIENEVYSELFASAMSEPTFWKAMSKTASTRSMMVDMVVKALGFSMKLTRTKGALQQNNHILGKMIKENERLTEALAEAIYDAFPSTTLRDKIERAFPDNAVIKEVKYASTKVQGVYKATTEAGKALAGNFPPGSRGYRDVMTKIEDWINNLLDWLAKNKPAGMFQDFRTKEEIVEIANKLLHAGAVEREQAIARVLKPHEHAFDGFTKEQLEKLHDDIIRDNDEAHVMMSLDSLAPPVRAAFEAMRKEADEIRKRMVEAGINVGYRWNHMGQSIQWYYKDRRKVDESIDAILRPDVSQLVGSKHFMKPKSQTSTAEIAQEYDYKTINPLELFANYVEESHKMIAVIELIKEGREKGFIRQFNSPMEAASHLGVDGRPRPMVALAGNTFQVMKEIPGGQEIEVQMGVRVHIERGLMPTKRLRDERGLVGPPSPIWFRNKDEARDFNTQEEADAWVASQPSNVGVQYKTEPIQKPTKTTITDNLYFDQELAHLVNVVMSKDKFRQGKLLGFSGEEFMNFKNTMTMLELSLSMFHWLTIGAETLSSYVGYKIKEHKLAGDSYAHARGVATLLNPIKAFREAKELKEFTQKVIADEAYASTPEAKALARKLLGTDDADMVDIYKQFFGHGGAFHQDETLRSGMQNWGDTEKSFMENLEALQAEHKDSNLLPLSKAMMHQVFVKMSSHLMEKIIPQQKFAAFAHEYALKVAKKEQELSRKLTESEKAALARDTMKFVEDRFGEVNWKNMWLNKTYKSQLQFLFRSFTWVAGSWKALGKAGIDVAKWGWFNVKYIGTDQKYELSEKAYWGIAALAVHMASVGVLSSIYALGAAAGDGDEQETDPDTPWMTKWLFPRVAPYDNTKRITIPSYVSEGYKIMMHLGLTTGGSFEPSKLVVGRLNSIIGRTMSLLANEDFRGVTIIDWDASKTTQAWALARHMGGMGMPMSLSGMKKIYEAEGMSKTMLFNALGAQDAPSAAKRSAAASLAFDLSRREYKGKEITEEEMDLKDDLKKAMRQYVDGDRSAVDELLAAGKTTQRKVDIAMTRYPVLGGIANPKYLDPLGQVLGRLSVKSALKVYEAMTDNEREKYTKSITKKVNNMRLRKDTPKEFQDRYIAEWSALKDEYMGGKDALVH